MKRDCGSGTFADDTTTGAPPPSGVAVAVTVYTPPEQLEASQLTLAGENAET